jgi:hypothetical protein
MPEATFLDEFGVEDQYRARRVCPTRDDGRLGEAQREGFGGGRSGRPLSAK